MLRLLIAQFFALSLSAATGIVTPSLPKSSRPIPGATAVNGKSLKEFHLPFEFSPKFLSGDYPIPECGVENREYSKVVGMVWSGINNRQAYLRAVESTSKALSGVADAVHIFAGKSDIARLESDKASFSTFSTLPAKARIPHDADANALISELKKLYLEALANPDEKIQVVLNISNHGDEQVGGDYSDKRKYSIPGSEGSMALSEEHLALIGKLLAPLDATIINGSCFSGDHDDIMFQNMLEQKKLLKEQGFPHVMKTCSCSLTKGGFGSPTFDADQSSLFEQQVFARPGDSMLSSSYSTFERQRSGLNLLNNEFNRYINEHKYGLNMLSSRSEKLALYLQGIKQYSAGVFADPRTIDETMAKFFDPTSSSVNLDKLPLPRELKAQLRETQSLVEQQVRNLKVPGLEGFSFDASESQGKKYISLLGETGASSTNVKSELGQLMRDSEIWDQRASSISRQAARGEDNPMSLKDGVSYNAKQTEEKRLEAIKAVHDYLKDNKEHKQQMAASMIKRHLLSVKMLTDPMAKKSSTQMSPLQKIFAWYRACEHMEMIPNVNPRFVEGTNTPRAIRESLHQERTPDSTKKGIGTR